MTTAQPSDQSLSFSERHATKRSLAALSGEAALTVEEVCTALRVSRAWLYSKAGRAVLLFTRHYHDVHPVTREEFELQDRMYRQPDGYFKLMVAGTLPGDPPVEQSYSLEEVFAWLQDCPWQIKRTVIEAT